MKALFIPQIPESITDVTTNSSSEIFVIGKDKEIELVDSLIDENSWRWWFGERKTFNSIDDVKKMMNDFPHAIEALFNLKGVPAEDDCSYLKKIEGEFILVNVKCSPTLKAARDDFNEWSRKNPWPTCEDKEKWSQYREIFWQKYHLVEDVFKKELDDWMNTQNLEQFVGAYYYECGEDNELAEWEKVHDTIPGNYCRLS